MISQLLTIVTNFVVHTISSLGYLGVILLMAIESACIPLPSEIIIPFAGFLAGTGRFTLFGVAMAGGVGSAIGSAVMYYIGLKGGRPLVEKYGRYIFISYHDLNLADKFFTRYGGASTFIGRLLPVVRTFISLPAGIERVPFWKFLWYSFLGSFIWSYALGYAGMKLGQNWDMLRDKFHYLDIVIVLAIALCAVWWIQKHVRQSKAN